MLTVEGLGKRYDGPNGHTLFDDLSFTLPPGGRLAVLGRNGQGKSSLIKILGGVLAPSSGRVSWTMSPSWPLGFAGGFQGSLTGLDNIRFISRIYGQPIEETIARTDDFAGLGDALQQPLKHYSSGMRARLAFGLSLAIEFDCYLIDEVIAVGDAAFQRRCHEELFDKRADRSFVIASHDLDLVQRTCDRAVVIDGGEAKVFDDIKLAVEIARAFAAPSGTDAPPPRRQVPKGEAFVWRREDFYSSDLMHRPATESMDITGPARILIFGPYVELPAGRWRVTARFDLSADAAAASYYVEFGYGADFQGRELRPASAGVYEVAIERRFADDATVELRLWLARAAFRGAVRFIEATVENLDDRPAAPAPRRKRKKDAS